MNMTTGHQLRCPKLGWEKQLDYIPKIFDEEFARRAFSNLPEDSRKKLTGDPESDKVKLKKISDEQATQLCNLIESILRLSNLKNGAAATVKENLVNEITKNVVALGRLRFQQGYVELNCAAKRLGHIRGGASSRISSRASAASSNPIQRTGRPSNKIAWHFNRLRDAASKDPVSRFTYPLFDRNTYDIILPPAKTVDPTSSKEPFVGLNVKLCRIWSKMKGIAVEMEKRGESIAKCKSPGDTKHSIASFCAHLDIVVSFFVFLNVTRDRPNSCLGSLRLEDSLSQSARRLELIEVKEKRLSEIDEGDAWFAKRKRSRMECIRSLIPRRSFRTQYCFFLKDI